MGAPKAELVIGGRRLLDRAVAVLADAGCAEVLAVVRAGTAVAGATAVVNESPERGMRSSLALAVDAAGPETDAIVVLLVDMPGIGPDAVRAVMANWRHDRITVASYVGRRGHPIVMSPQLWREALALAADDEGARALMRTRSELVDEIPAAGDPTDLDTAADLASWARVDGPAAEG